MNDHQNKIDTILNKALQRETPSTDEVVFLLGLENQKDINKLFAAAKSLREAHFGNKIFLYGFIYISTYCRNDCRFCFRRQKVCVKHISVIKFFYTVLFILARIAAMIAGFASFADPIRRASAIARQILRS
jgi:methylornithine synthase